MNVKDGLYGAFIGATVSAILWFLNYFLLENPKINLEYVACVDGKRSKRRLGQDPTKLLNFTKCWVCNSIYILLK